VPLIILTGKEYGSGSSRDWAAKGAKLPGVVAVLAERDGPGGEERRRNRVHRDRAY
jgi:hypothetical protein